MFREHGQAQHLRHAGHNERTMALQCHGAPAAADAAARAPITPNQHVREYSPTAATACRNKCRGSPYLPRALLLGVVNGTGAAPSSSLSAEARTLSSSAGLHVDGARIDAALSLGGGGAGAAAWKVRADVSPPPAGADAQVLELARCSLSDDGWRLV